MPQDNLPAGQFFQRVVTNLSARFSLRSDKADDATIDESLRANVELRGTNLWVLIFAIFIASIGLNVNSTAVIIGAMLISPLMGPIMGVGYGVGIYDFALIRKSLRNLGVMTLISLITSTAYFLISPLSKAQSELLARTTPTIWDVLIALFGGLAGIIGATRKEKSNVLPGVAIATALMPPLCTAGYGLATANFKFFFGAFYLFSINSVYIAFSTVLVVWWFKSPHKRFVDSNTANQVKRYLSAVVTMTLLPSIYLAYVLVAKEVFDGRARSFVKQELNFAQTHVTETNIVFNDRLIEATLIGDPVEKTKLAEIESRLAQYRLAGAKLIVHQFGDQRVDITSLKASIISDLYRDSQRNLEEKDKTIQQLQSQLANVSVERSKWKDIPLELRAQNTKIQDVLLSEAVDWSNAEQGQPVTLLYVKTSARLNKKEQQAITRWLKVRVKSESVKVIIE